MADFPYKKKFIPYNPKKFIKDLHEFILFPVNQKLKEQLIKENKLTPYLGPQFNLEKYAIIQESYYRLNHINIITDLFQEEERVKCRFENYPSPLQFWINNKNKIKEFAKKKFEGRVNDFTLRESISMLNKECTLFYITTVITLLRKFKVKRWLDMSAGWGDRLIGAIAAKVKYVATDPNINLHKNYKKIIDALEPYKKLRSNYILIPSGFENAILPKNLTYDFIFTSPPFYDKEIYSDNLDDSLIKYRTLEEWIEKFLLYSIKKGWELLEKNGHYLIYIRDKIKGKKLNYVNIMIDYINKEMKGSKYLGQIYFFRKSGIKKPRGIHVWKKIS